MEKLERQSNVRGHICALISILIWGNTFISTKILLRSFVPAEILFARSFIAFIALNIIHPKRLRIKDKKQELFFLAAGICGITLYFLLENFALTMTNAGNVSIIVTVAPFFTAIISALVLKTEKPRANFYVGFVAALGGIALISLTGSGGVSVNLRGDLLAMLAALTWAVYSHITKKISEFGYNTIQVTRRIFFYGLITMIPVLPFIGFKLDFSQYASAINLGNILFLGLGASAICFVTWNTALKYLGPVKTTAWIYANPVVTLIASTLILKEPLTPLLITGALLTLAGLWLSQTRIFSNRKIKAPGN